MNAPGLIDYDVLNVFRTMVGRGEIDAELGGVVPSGASATAPVRHVMSERIWQLRHNVSAYDASYVALAEHRGMPLVTAERRLTTAVEMLTTVDFESYVQTHVTRRTAASLGSNCPMITRERRS